MSPHVVPKARASPSSSFEEEEKTTIEAGWEEEPSTTVEQGEVAERIRAMANEPRRTITNVTSTGVLEEPTVDDQRANAALSLITPAALKTRLLVTTGNDSGQDLPIEPGRTYTIGRAIDNDLVLTDIAVSRKHFDLRFDHDRWVVVDRGSGNGTLVNGAVEDQPFVLANGDAIEIGNTVFRFEQPNGVPRPMQTYDASLDVSLDASLEVSADASLGSIDSMEEEEPSTVAGKPIRAEEAPPLLPVMAAHPRPKTLPPPIGHISRARSMSQPPPPAFPPMASSFPPPDHAAMSAAMTHQLPQHLIANQIANQVPRQGPAAPTMLAGLAPPGQIPSTIPGQGAPQSMPPGFNAYANPLSQSSQHAAQHASLPPHLQHHPSYPQHHISSSMPRDATSTALVGHYNGSMAVAQPYRAAGFSRRGKMILGAAGLTLLAAIATIAIIKGTSGGAKGAAPEGGTKAVANGGGSGQGSAQVRVEPIEPPKKDPKIAPPKTLPDPPKVADPPKVDPPKVVVADPPKVVVADPPKVDPPKVVVADPPKVDPPKVVKKDPPKVVKKDPPKVVKKDPPKVVKKDPPKRTPKRVAMASTEGVRAKADALYRSKNFNDAAATLTSAAKNFGPGEASDLKSLAGVYSQFSKQFNLGMAPSTSSKNAWTALLKARNLDNSAGNAFGSQISARLGQIAPGAAAAFMAAKDFATAKKAIGIAETTGNRNSTTDGIRASLELRAGDLVRQAQAEMSKDPDGAKQKLKLVQRMVDPKSQWYQRAGKLLSGAS